VSEGRRRAAAATAAVERGVAAAAVALLALAMALDAAAASPSRPLTGTYAFAGRTLVDPPPGEPQDTHLIVTLDGDAARALYAKLKATPKRDACLDDGSLTKRAGDLQCTATAKPRGYTCTFGVDLERRTLAPGSVC